MLSVSKSSLGVTARGRAKPLAICGTRGGSEVVVSVVPATLHHLLAALLFPKRVNLRYPAILHINGSAIALPCNRPPNSAVSRRIAIPRYRRRRSGPLHASPHRRMCSLVGVNWREERTVVFGSLSDPAEHQVVVVVLLRLLASDGFPPSRPHSRNNGTSLNSKKTALLSSAGRGVQETVHRIQGTSSIIQKQECRKRGCPPSPSSRPLSPLHITTHTKTNKAASWQPCTRTW